MKIAQITECLTDNGVSTVIRNLTSGFREAGHQVDIITWRDSKDTDPGLRKIKVRGLGDDRVSLLDRILRRLLGQRLWCYFRSARFCRQLLEQIDLDKYDAALIHGLACIPLWQLPNRLIIVAHSTKSKMLLRPRQLFFRPLLRKLYSKMYQAHPVVCVSKGAREDMIATFGVEPDNVIAIYNPVPIEEIRRKSLDPIDDVPEEYLLAVGRPVKSKRFDRLMQVYKMSGIQAPLVVMVGTGKKEKVEKLARRYGLSGRVYTIGYRENPYPYMASAKLLAMTSDYEGFGLVLVESLACGTPVISTDCPSGPAEILTGSLREGLVSLGDDEIYSVRLRELFRQPSAIVPQMIQKFDHQESVAKYLKLFKECG